MSGSGKAKTDKARVPCSLCKANGEGKVIHNPDIKEAGTHIGDGGILGANIMTYRYSMKGKTAKDHPLSVPHSRNPKHLLAQAHHLICSQTMKEDKDWPLICKNYGYTINHSNNGLFLPSDMRVACQEEIPLHKSSHVATETLEEGVNYVMGVEEMVRPIKAKGIKGDYCKPGEDIISELNDVSNDIKELVLDFDWTLTEGGRDFDGGGVGCKNQNSIPKKRESKRKCSKIARKHGIVIIGKYFKE